MKSLNIREESQRRVKIPVGDNDLAFPQQRFYLSFSMFSSISGEEKRLHLDRDTLLPAQNVAPDELADPRGRRQPVTAAWLPPM